MPKEEPDYWQACRRGEGAPSSLTCWHGAGYPDPAVTIGLMVRASPWTVDTKMQRTGKLHVVQPIRTARCAGHVEDVVIQMRMRDAIIVSYAALQQRLKTIRVYRVMDEPG